MCLRFALRTCTLVFQTRYSKWTNSSNSWALVLSKHIAAKTHWRAGNSGNSHVRGEEKEQKRISDFYRCYRNGSVAKSRPRLRQPAVRMVDITSAFSIVIPRNFGFLQRELHRLVDSERKPKLNVTRISYCDVMHYRGGISRDL